MGIKGILAIMGLGALLTVAAVGSFEMVARTAEGPAHTRAIGGAPSRSPNDRVGQIKPEVNVVAKPISPEVRK